MKRLLTLALLVLAAVCWSAPMTLTVMTNGVQTFTEWEKDFRGYVGVREKIAAEFAEARGIKVTVLYRDVSKGSMTVDAMMAAGTPPDIWIDATSYFGKYMNKDYAIPFQKYVDTSQFLDHLIKLYTVDGNVYALPFSNVGEGFGVNQSLLDQVGYKVPVLEKWTTDEFLNLGKLLKAKKIPLTMVMMKGGLNSWTQYWLYAFGASFFKDGNYKRTTMNSPEAIKGLEYLKQLDALGYAYPNPLEVNDDDAVELFTTNKVATAAMQNGHADGWLPEQMKLGKIKEMPVIRFYPVPHAPGLKDTPLYSYQTIAVAHTSGDAGKDKLIADLTIALVGKEAQFYNCLIAGGFPTVKNWQPKLGTSANQMYADVAGLMLTAPVLHPRPPGDLWPEVRRIWYAHSEAWWRGKETAQQFLAAFEKEANAVLNK